MKEYEVIQEITNACGGSNVPQTTISEMELDDIEAYVKSRHPKDFVFVEALQKQAHVEYLLDVLLFSDMEERAALIASYGKEVRNLERRMADLAARTAAGRDGHHRSRTPAPER